MIREMTRVLTEMVGLAEMDGLAERSNAWRSALIDANAILAANDAQDRVLRDAYVHVTLLATGQRTAFSNAEMCERLGAALFQGESK